MNVIKQLSAILFLLVFSTGAIAQTENPGYNPELAAALKGNDNGMKKYMFAILKTGTERIQQPIKLL